MNKISATMYQYKHTRSAHPVFTIDGTPISSWIKGIIYDHLGEDDTDGLVPAQGWLTDEDHSAYAWQLLSPLEEDSSTIVPLLICPDDMDLSCTVAVVEQVVRGEKIVWARFGRAVKVINGIITSVAWTQNNQRAEFEKSQFLNACEEFKRLTEHEWV